MYDLIINPHASRGKAAKKAQKVIGILNEKGVEFAAHYTAREKEAIEIAKELSEKGATDIIALGGDGTILHAARLAALANKPVLGINNGTLGFMAGLEADELDLLDRLKTGDYITDRRMMLEINVKSADVSHKYYCLNDAVIARGDMSRIIDCSVSFGAKTEMEYRCDGIIVATPTGSTAYSLSAGGPVLDPSINSILLTPVCAHSFYARPLVLSPDISVSIQTSTKSGGKAVLTVDGELGVELKSDDIVEISRSDDYCATLIKLKNESFMDVLYNKMIDRK